MLKQMQDSNNHASIPFYDPSLLKTLADQEIINYRVKLLKVINYARLLFAGGLLFYFLTIKESANGINFLFNTTEYDYDYLQLFWVLFSAYILIVVLCNIALSYQPVGRGLFLLMAYLEVGVLIFLLAMVFNRQLANVNMMIILCSLLLSILTLTYIESIILGISLSCILFVYLVKVMIHPRLEFLLHDDSSLLDKIAVGWQVLGQHQFELIDPIIYSASLALLIVMVGYLASQARDNKIFSRLSNLYNKQLYKLNNSIIEDMKSGLMVVNEQGVILTLNQKAKKIFNLPAKVVSPPSLSNLSVELAENYHRWLHARFSDSRTLKLGASTYSISFNNLHKQEVIDLTLITLESVEESMQRIREARLVSLGRLSAGIAHEIRNPLASIQSAADILAEQTADEQTAFLSKKITVNTKRINVIVSDVLNMFNVTAKENKLMHLNTELEKIIRYAQQDTLTKDAAIKLDIKDSDPYYVYFDSGHLGQILNNLIMNSIIHSDVNKVKMTITSQVSKISRQIYLDICDNGVGVNEIDQDKIFEPFFSKRNGTGLGLYLIREMCLANQAQIEYLHSDKGACFRITMERFLCDEVSN